jgi:enoyl-CoA hydratase
VDYLGFERQDDTGIATITFNRPEALNALNLATMRELAKVLEQVVEDEGIKVLILTGAGAKAFIAGADIAEIQQLSPLGGREFARLGQAIIDRLQHLAVPVIAAVNGYALGGGCEMALACDFIYASETAVFGLPEIALGIIPGFGGTQRLPRLVGANMAREMIFTGKFLTASEAKEIGLVNRCFPPDQLLSETQAVARLMAKNGRVSLRAAKDAIRAGQNVDLQTGLAIERDAFALCLASPDAKEGTTAFLEKRKAKFTGRRDI